MAKQCYFARLIPPRTTFPGDASEAELELMQRHFAYTKAGFDAGQVLVFGPVFAEAGAFGVAIMEVDDVAEVHAFMNGDPSVASGMNGYDVSPMRLAGSQPSRSAD